MTYYNLLCWFFSTYNIGIVTMGFNFINNYQYTNNKYLFLCQFQPLSTYKWRPYFLKKFTFLSDLFAFLIICLYICKIPIRRIFFEQIKRRLLY